jgi:hypothetical protein
VKAIHLFVAHFAVKLLLKESVETVQGDSLEAREMTEPYWLNEHPLEQKVLEYKHEIVDYMEEVANEHRGSLHERIGRNY